MNTDYNYDDYQLMVQVLGLGSPLSDTSTREILTSHDGFAVALSFLVVMYLLPHTAYTTDKICTKCVLAIWILTTISMEQLRLRTLSKESLCIPLTVPRPSRTI